LRRRRAGIVAAPWTWLRQVHGARVVTVEHPGQWAGVEADAAVTAVEGAPLCVLAADCAPVVLLGQGVAGPSVGVAHVGWRGLVAGVVGETASAMRALGASTVTAVVGPHIGPECYEFGDADLRSLEGALGPRVRGTTAAGRPALDLGAGVLEALAGAGVGLAGREGACTACDPAAYFSHRARHERERLTAVVWLGG
jgi:YfiH family protein